MSIEVVPAGGGRRVELARGQTLRITDPNGGQSGDVLAFRAGDVTEWLSNGRSFDYGGKIYFSTGDVLYSNQSNPMLTIVHDDVGHHDFLYAPCSIEMYRLQHGATDSHPNCLDNLAHALADLGITRDRVPTPFNVFLNATVEPDGRLVIGTPRSRAGDTLCLRAEMDLLVAITACPSAGCNGGAPLPLTYEVV